MKNENFGNFRTLFKNRNFYIEKSIFIFIFYINFSIFENFENIFFYFQNIFFDEKIKVEKFFGSSYRCKIL